MTGDQCINFCQSSRVVENPLEEWCRLGQTPATRKTGPVVRVCSAETPLFSYYQEQQFYCECFRPLEHHNFYKFRSVSRAKLSGGLMLPPYVRKSCYAMESRSQVRLVIQINPNKPSLCFSYPSDGLPKLGKL